MENKRNQLSVVVYGGRSETILSFKGAFTNYVMDLSLLIDHPPTYGYGFAMILLNMHLIKFEMVIFC